MDKRRKLKVYLESSFVSYLTPHSLPLTKKIVRKAGFHCPDIMTPKTFLDNIDLEK